MKSWFRYNVLNFHGLYDDVIVFLICLIQPKCIFSDYTSICFISFVYFQKGFCILIVVNLSLHSMPTL